MKIKTLISFFAFFTSLSSLASDQYYARIDLGAAFSPRNKADVANKKLSNTNSIIANVGLGTYVKDTIRAEMSLYMSGDINRKSQSNSSIPGVTDVYEKHKITQQSLFLKIIPEIYDAGYGKFHIHAGVGLSRIKDTVTLSYNLGGQKLSDANTGKYRFYPSYTLGAGYGFFLSEILVLDFNYAYVDAGVTKSSSHKINGTNVEISKIHSRSHNITAGLRLSF